MKKIALAVLFLAITCVNTYAILLENLIKEKKLASTLSGKKIGYYHGSFDPLHKGHEKIVEMVLKQHLCDYIIVYPAWGNDHFKKRLDLSLRLQMLFSVYIDHPNVVVTRLSPKELQMALMKEAPIKGKVESKFGNVTYVGIIGSDVALEMVQPENSYRLSYFLNGDAIPETLKEHTVGGFFVVPAQSFIIALRKGDQLDFLKNRLGDRPILSILYTPFLDVSSTHVRDAIKRKESIHFLVNQSVQLLIERNNLYQ